MTYLSSLKTLMVNNCLDTLEWAFQENWYNTVRRTVAKLYVRQASKTGKKLVIQSDDLSHILLESICDDLLASYFENLEDPHQDKPIWIRAALTLTCNLLGRATEVGSLNEKQI